MSVNSGIDIQFGSTRFKDIMVYVGVYHIGRRQFNVYLASAGDWNLQEWKMTDHLKTGGGICRTGK